MNTSLSQDQKLIFKLIKLRNKSKSKIARIDKKINKLTLSSKNILKKIKKIDKKLTKNHLSHRPSWKFKYNSILLEFKNLNCFGAGYCLDNTCEKLEKKLFFIRKLLKK